MTEQIASSTAEATSPKVPTASSAILGPLTVRDVSVLAAVVIIFVASLLPIVLTSGFARNLWTLSGLYFLTIGILLPLTVGALFAIRRLSPEKKPRVGSLSVDQFASVVAVFAAGYFFLSLVTHFEVAVLVGLIGALVLVSATALAQMIPIFAGDFVGRNQTPSRPEARDAVPAIRRPAAPKAMLALPAGHQGAQGRTNWSAPDQQPTHSSAGQIFTPSSGTFSPGDHVGGTLVVGIPSAGIPGNSIPVAAASATTATAAQSGEKAADVAATTSLGTTSSATTASATQSDEKAADVADVVPPAKNEPSTEADTSEADTDTTLNPQVVSKAPVADSIGATVDPRGARPAATDPFWFAVDRPQNVVDENTGQFAFKLTPGTWFLALDDRGSSFIVQDGHGKTGVLLDLVGIERAPAGD